MRWDWECRGSDSVPKKCNLVSEGKNNKHLGLYENNESPDEKIRTGNLPASRDIS